MRGGPAICFLLVVGQGCKSNLDTGGGTDSTTAGTETSQGTSAGTSGSATSNSSTSNGTGTSTDSATATADTTTTLGSTGSTSVTDTTTGGSSGGGTVCGNGVLEAGEECDSVPGCTGCVLDNWDCNPLNNEPCPDGWKCSYREPTPGDPSFSCMVFSNTPPGQLHEGNCYEFEPKDEWCDVGLACTVTSGSYACMVADTNCCVEYCDLTDQNFVCANPMDECVPFWVGPVEEGLGNLGICLIP